MLEKRRKSKEKRVMHFHKFSPREDRDEREESENFYRQERERKRKIDATLKYDLENIMKIYQYFRIDLRLNCIIWGDN